MKATKSDRIFLVSAYVVAVIFAAFCLFPFLLVIGSSFTDEDTIRTLGYSIIPHKFSLFAYNVLLSSYKSLLNAYGVSIFVTVIGTVTSLFVMSMTAYVIQRKDFPYRQKLSFFMYFTTLFSGGLVPWYILITQYLHLRNNIMVLVLPALFNVFNIIIIRTFMSSISESIIESAKIDGAGDFRIFIQLILPLSKPALATMGLFTALSYWNDWFHAMLFIDNDKLIPLQYYLNEILTRMDFLRNNASSALGSSVTVDPPAESFKMATAVVTMGPILLLYPFLQKYFVKGIMIGSVKG